MITDVKITVMIGRNVLDDALNGATSFSKLRHCIILCQGAIFPARVALYTSDYRPQNLWAYETSARTLLKKLRFASDEPVAGVKGIVSSS